MRYVVVICLLLAGCSKTLAHGFLIGEPGLC